MGEFAKAASQLIVVHNTASHAFQTQRPATCIAQPEGDVDRISVERDGLGLHVKVLMRPLKPCKSVKNACAHRVAGPSVHCNTSIAMALLEVLLSANEDSATQQSY